MLRPFPPALLLAAASGCGAPPPGPLEAVITSHDDGEAVVARTAFVAEGRVSGGVADPTDLAVTWRLGDDVLCEGPPEAGGATACTFDLPAGNQALTLTATTPDGLDHADIATLVVAANTPPAIAWTAPDEDLALFAGTGVQLVAEVLDAEDAGIDLTLAWSSSDPADDLSGFDRIPDAAGLVAGFLVPAAAGSRVITLEATDPHGATTRVERTLDVGAPNAAPTCALAAPLDDALLADLDALTLEGQAADPDDGAATLTWSLTSDVDGLLGEGSVSGGGFVSATLPAPSYGDHALTLEVRDPRGARCRDTHAVAWAASPVLADVRSAPAVRVDQGTSTGLSATVADADTDPTTLAVAWESNRDGLLDSAPPDATGAIGFATPYLSRGSHTITLTVTDDRGLTAVETLDLLVNGPPEAPSVRAVPTTPRTTDDLIAELVAPTVDVEGDAVTHTFTWTASSPAGPRTWSGARVPAEETARGEVWTVTVTPSDGSLTGPSSAASTAVLNSPPEVTEVALAPERPVTGDVITVTPTGRDADGDPITWSYRWTVDGVALPAGPSPTHGPVQRGQRVQVTAFAADGVGGSGSGASDRVTVADAPPSTPVVVLEPDPVPGGDALRCTLLQPGLDPEGAFVFHRVAWTVDDAPSAGPFEVTALPDDTVSSGVTVDGETWRCTVTPEADGLQGAPATAEILVGVPS